MMPKTTNRCKTPRNISNLKSQQNVYNNLQNKTKHTTRYLSCFLHVFCIYSSTSSVKDNKNLESSNEQGTKL